MNADETIQEQAARIAELEAGGEDLMANCNDLRKRCWEAEGLNKRLEGFALSTCLEAGWELPEARAALERIKKEPPRDSRFS